jgi:hypothetical protein
MAKFHFAYSGGGSMPESEADQKAMMDSWIAWFGTLGDAVVDGGNPFGPSKSVSNKGVRDAGVSTLGGYSLVSAKDIDAAVELAKGCPIIASGGFVDVYETFDVI